MDKIRLGKTGMMVSRLGFGGVPMQRLSEKDAIAVVKRCLELGINFLDTASEYINGEEYIGKAIREYNREELIISTKSNYGNRQLVERNLEKSLNDLGSTYIDLYQFHRVNDDATLDAILGGDAPMAVIHEAKKAGVIRHFGITSHSMALSMKAVKAGLFETVMFPFNFICTEAADQLLPLTRRYDVGFIAMKPMAGGMLSSATIPFKYILQFPDIVTIPGIQQPAEINEIIGFYEKPQSMTTTERNEMQHLRKELSPRFCRRCNICEPCPENVSIVHALDILCFIKNMPTSVVFGENVAEQLSTISQCNKCGECEKRCPYGIRIMDVMDEFYKLYLSEYKLYQQ